MCFRTEFKEIRKEWKARKKEEENARKAEEERQRQAAQAAAQNGAPDGPNVADGGQPPSSYPGSRPVQLPPIGYQPGQYPAPPSAGMQQPMSEYGGNHVYNYQPASPYGQPSQQMYNQRSCGTPYFPIDAKEDEELTGLQITVASRTTKASTEIRES